MQVKYMKCGWGYLVIRKYVWVSGGGNECEAIGDQRSLMLRNLNLPCHLGATLLVPNSLTNPKIAEVSAEVSPGS